MIIHLSDSHKVIVRIWHLLIVQVGCALKLFLIYKFSQGCRQTSCSLYVAIEGFLLVFLFQCENLIIFHIWFYCRTLLCKLCKKKNCTHIFFSSSTFRHVKQWFTDGPDVPWWYYGNNRLLLHYIRLLNQYIACTHLPFRNYKMHHGPLIGK